MPKKNLESVLNNDTGVQLTIRQLDAGTILIEGDKKTLNFLGNLLVAQASETDCGFQIGPKSAGAAVFNKKSKFGLYIHRIPCSCSPKKVQHPCNNL